MMALNLTEASDLLFNAITDSKLFCLITDLKGKILYANKGTCEILNFKANDVLGSSLFSFLLYPSNLQEILKNQKVYQGFVEGKTKEGLPFYLYVEIIPFQRDGKEVGFICLGANLLERGDLYSLQITTFDSLTGIPHERGFSTVVNAYIERYKRPFSLLVVDICGFSTLVITYDLSFIQALFKEISQRLKNILPPQAFIGRTQGDEFLITLFETTKEKLGILITDILDCFYNPFIIEERVVVLTVNIGASSYPEDGETFEQLFSKALFALKTAKRKGENTFSIYGKNLEKEVQTFISQKEKVAKLLKEKSFIPYGQPYFQL